jgi:DNA (cytosine-5)-methyltransferase 1
MKVIYYDIPEKVEIRKHTCDIKEFQAFLKMHKKTTIKQIANALNISKTEVDHWFRSDKHFSIPNKNIWVELKKILKIKSNKYDAFVTEFIEQDGVHEQSNRVYDINGIAPTITSTGADIRIIF